MTAEDGPPITQQESTSSTVVLSQCRPLLPAVHCCDGGLEAS
jgi:hypothetical protein